MTPQTMRIQEDELRELIGPQGRRRPSSLRQYTRPSYALTEKLQVKMTNFSQEFLARHESKGMANFARDFRLH